MKFEGTKGKWEVRASGYRDYVSIDAIQENGKIKNIVYCSTNEDNFKEMYENFKLMASAKNSLDALKSLTGIEAWIGDSEMKRHFQKTVYPAIEKAF